MPRSIDEILQHADELAARFENYEPDPSHELDAGAVALLRSAILERSQAERHLIDAIRTARARPGCPGRPSDHSSARAAKPSGRGTRGRSPDPAAQAPHGCQLRRPVAS